MRGCSCVISMAAPRGDCPFCTPTPRAAWLPFVSEAGSRSAFSLDSMTCLPWPSNPSLVHSGSWLSEGLTKLCGSKLHRSGIHISVSVIPDPYSNEYTHYTTSGDHIQVEFVKSPVTPVYCPSAPLTYIEMETVSAILLFANDRWLNGTSTLTLPLDTRSFSCYLQMPFLWLCR